MTKIAKPLPTGEQPHHHVRSLATAVLAVYTAQHIFFITERTAA